MTTTCWTVSRLVVQAVRPVARVIRRHVWRPVRRAARAHWYAPGGPTTVWLTTLACVTSAAAPFLMPHPPTEHTGAPAYIPSGAQEGGGNELGHAGGSGAGGPLAGPGSSVAGLTGIPSPALPLPAIGGAVRLVAIIHPIPEPATAATFALAVLALVALRLWLSRHRT